jgi:ribonuclease R
VLTQAQKDAVFRFIRQLKSTGFTFRDVVRVLDLDSDDRRSLQRYLDELDSDGVIHRIKRGRYALPSREALVSGTLSCHRDGYGFLIPDDRMLYPQDIFIPARNMEDALHGDRILVKVAKKKKPDSRFHAGKRRPTTEKEERLEGTVVRVVERKSPCIVGRYYEHPRFPFAVPLDARIIHDIRVPFNHSKGARDGQIVVLALTRPPGRHQEPEGKVVEILGYPGDKDIEYRIVESKFGLPVEFSAAARAEADAIPEIVRESEKAGREDFREEISFTIDGETARDFDDAVTLKKLENGNFRLGVHIADVSHYVIEGSAIDREAYARGTSVYFPDRAIPMLPPRLSSGICSLKAGEERLVFSVIMDIDQRGEVVSKRFSKGLLLSQARLTYTEVAEVLLKRDPEQRKRHSRLLPTLETMEELCRILAKKRYRRGAVDFDLPEAEIEFDETGKVISVVQAERNLAHRIIEEFMLLANESVAAQLSSCGGPALYRIHEKPDTQKVNDFAEFALALGYRLENRAGEYRPRDFQKFVEQLEGKVEGRFLAYLMLRSFMQARYSEVNVGHFGLATAEYTHFTSPIRRYPDLVVHRLLKNVVGKSADAGWRAKMAEQMPVVAAHTSARERNADEAEREIEKIKKVEFMAGKIGDEFDAIVFSVTRQGFFIELADHFVEGFVPSGTLVDDRYLYKERTHTFVAERNKKRFELGSRIRARLDHADRESFRLIFSVV